MTTKAPPITKNECYAYGQIAAIAQVLMGERGNQTKASRMSASQINKAVLTPAAMWPVIMPIIARDDLATQRVSEIMDHIPSDGPMRRMMIGGEGMDAWMGYHHERGYQMQWYQANA